ncbi:hypothetical protein PMAYCL1PPCAC_29968, partial [Pristionchus mayeri]
WNPMGTIDLPPLVDTSLWRESSPLRHSPFLDELTALNFSRPIHNPSDYRLSGVDSPSLYEVQLSVQLRGREEEDKSSFSGKSRTFFTRIGAPSDTVELHLFGLYIATASLSCDSRPLFV